MGASKDYHVASFSGGKDSLAMVLRLREEGLPLDEVIFAEVGWEFPENLKVIFERFKQVGEGARSSTKGFGLGLNYVKNMTKIHNGNIRLESQVGVGSIFKLKFPVVYE